MIQSGDVTDSSLLGVQTESTKESQWCMVDSREARVSPNLLGDSCPSRKDGVGPLKKDPKTRCSCGAKGVSTNTKESLVEESCEMESSPFERSFSLSFIELSVKSSPHSEPLLSTSRDRKIFSGSASAVDPKN